MEEDRKLHLTFPLLESYQGSIYMGTNPPHGVMVPETHNRYIVPGEECILWSASCDYKSNCFLEVSVTADIELDEALSEELVSNKEDVKKYFLEEAEKRKQNIFKILDTLCGIIGLRFHRQFVLKPLVENRVIEGGPEPVMSFASGAVESLEKITLTDNGVDILNSLINSLENVEENKYANASRILQWLLRAWRETDPVVKFLYLFIPLECVIGSAGEMDEELAKKIAILYKIVERSDCEDKKSLLEFLNIIESKFAPTLNSRFESFARSSGIDRWEEDVKAFRKFNKTRNLLLHAGRAKVESRIKSGKFTVTLEDMVERYIALALLGSPDVYQSSWRPNRSGKNII